MNAIVSALRFFFTQTLDRPDLARKLVRMRHVRKLPVVLSHDEVARLLAATTCLKHQAALSVAYGAGLRAAEVAALKVRDIDSERMLLRVERGKGGRYRTATTGVRMVMAGLLLVESRCSACLPQRSTAALRSMPHLNRAARAPPAQRVRASTRSRHP